MARRNLFQPPAPPDTSVAETPAPETKSRFPNTGAMSGVKSTLKDLSSNAVREIPVALIEEDGPKDRLAFSDADVASLAESIRAHGQQVPIMIRPIAEKPGHYRIVYGRRRLRALRALDRPAKALVRTLSDQEAILAQGQENAQRLDPSFIEKSLFAAELVGSGHDQSVILDALAIDKPMLSRMTKVARELPEAAIQAIGPAHGIGRRRWEELADLVRSKKVDLAKLVAALDLQGAGGSDKRFMVVRQAVDRFTKEADKTVEAPPARTVSSSDGTLLAEIKDSPRALTLKLSKTGNAGFARWMCDNAEIELQRLYEAWRSDQKTD